MRVDTDDKNAFLVFVYDEQPILTNVLRALAMFKREVSGWPRMVGVRNGNRLPFALGSDTRIEITDWMLLGAIYLSTYNPLLDAPEPEGEQLTPTIFTGKRTPAKSKKYKIHRSRRNA